MIYGINLKKGVQLMLLIKQYFLLFCYPIK